MGPWPVQRHSIEANADKCGQGKDRLRNMKRHIKCDETKPSCVNCLKTRGSCEGYVIKTRKNSAPRSNQRSPPSFISHVDRTLLKEPGVNSVDFDSELQELYFSEWCDLVHISLGGSGNPRKLWTTFMPQLTRQNIALRHAAISIGAISRSMITENVTKAQEGKALANPVRSPHYYNAVAHYCKALRLQSQICANDSNLHELMLMSILFITFEALRGDIRSALQHLTYSFRLVQQLFIVNGTEAMSPRYTSPARELIGEVIGTFTQLGIQTQTVLGGTLSTSKSPIRRLMRRLRLQGHTMEACSKKLSPFLGPRLELHEMLEVFKTTEEADIHFTAIKRHIAELGRKLKYAFQNMNLEQVDEEEAIDQALTMVKHNPEIHNFVSQSISHLDRWYKAFQPLYNRVMGDCTVDRKAQIQLIHLRIQYLALHLDNVFPQHAVYVTMEAMTPACRELNELCEILLREQDKTLRSPAHTFTMNDGLTGHLAFVAINCRDPIVRENAIHILEAYPRRDGLWDSGAFLAVAVRLREVERENSKEGTLAEQWQRLSKRAFAFEDAGTRIMLRSMRKIPNSTKWGLIEETAEYNSSGPDLWKNLTWKERPMDGRRLILQWGKTSDPFLGLDF